MYEEFYFVVYETLDNSDLEILEFVPIINDLGDFTFNYGYNVTFINNTKLKQISDNPKIFNVSLRSEFNINQNFNINIKHYLKDIKISSPLGKSYPPLKDQIEYYPNLQDTDFFVPDYLALRFIIKNSGLTADEILLALVSLANIFRYCDLYNVREIYLGPFKFLKGKSTWIVSNY